MQEIWKDIKDYEGYYQVSNFGNVRRIGKSKNRTLSTDKNGYKVVCLSVFGITKMEYVHRLVAEAFIEKLKGCEVVNHIDNNPSNNSVMNLEWTTHKGNTQHAIAQGRFKNNLTLEIRLKGNEIRKRPVKATNDKETLYYHQISDTKKDGFIPTNIVKCCQGKRKTAGGYRWEYVTEVNL